MKRFRKVIRMTHTGDYKYLKFISYLQIIGIILVVLGHSFHQYPDGKMGHSLWFYRLLYNVRMPLFTFVSGYLMYYTSFVAGIRERTWTSYTLNKTKRLLIPYFTLSLVTFVPRASMSAMADDSIEMSVRGLIHSLVFANQMVIPYFWFIYMSFILLVVTYAFLILCKRIRLADPVAIFMLIAIFAYMPFFKFQATSAFALNEVVRLGSYFTLGIAYCYYSSSIDKYLHKSTAWIVIVVSASAWIVLYFAYENTIITRLSSLFGIIFFVTLCHTMEDYNITILDHLQGTNYIIFLLSWYVNVTTQQVLAHFVALPWWIHTLLSFFGGIYVPYLGFKYLQRHPQSLWVRLTAFLLGQKLKLPASGTIQNKHLKSGVKIP